MELHFSTALPTTTTTGYTFSVLKYFPSKPSQVSIISQPRTGFLNSRIRPCARRSRRSSPVQPEEEDSSKKSDKKKDKAFHWRSTFLGETSIATDSAKSKKKFLDTSYFGEEETDNMDWCVRARKLALKTIEERGFGDKLRKMVTPKKKRKKRKSGKGKLGKLSLGALDHILDNVGSEDELEGDPKTVNLFTLDFDSGVEVGGKTSTSLKNDQSALTGKIGQYADGIFEEKRANAKAAFVDRLSQFSGPSNHKMEVALNKQIVNARTAEEVLDVISDTVTAVAKGLSPSPLSPLNIATALHRIAKNMEKVQMIETRRLGFVRQKEMSLLVGIAMTALPNCNAQGLSNITWALSKIGSDLLFQSEMDRIASIAITKVDDFNAQNVANVALAYATMRHAAPDLFTKLASRAIELVETFKELEMTQFLWACATLNAHIDPFLDALDTIFYKQVGLLSENETEDEIENAMSFESLEDREDLDEIEDETENEISSESGEDIDLDEIEHEFENEIDSLGNIEDLDITDDLWENVKSSYESHETCALNLTRDQIASIAWSYAVLGQTGRPFFSSIWSIITQLVAKRVSDQFREDVLFASQIYVANQCLKVENPNSGLALKGDLEKKIYRVGQTKRFNIKTTSLFQKEVARLLVATGSNWVREYPIDGYTVDAVLVDEKVAFEIDGPSHFSRNLGTPLGHTMMKRRYIAAAGWKLVSLSHYEWEALSGEFKQLEYLRKIIGNNEDISSGCATENEQ